MSSYQAFTPDLIVEATSVCDRACKGCYAPNFVSRESPSLLYRRYPSLFLQPAALERALAAVPGRPGTLSLRGGEPTRHPELPLILELCTKVAGTVWLETHGRWISTSESADLLKPIRESGTWLKISYDRMHGMDSANLGRIALQLGNLGIRFAIAITEPDSGAFVAVRNEILWVPDHQIIFQTKATRLADLIAPSLGVIHTNGALTGTVSARNSFVSEKAAV